MLFHRMGSIWQQGREGTLLGQEALKLSSHFMKSVHNERYSSDMILSGNFRFDSDGSLAYLVFDQSREKGKKDKLQLHRWRPDTQQSQMVWEHEVVDPQATQRTIAYLSNSTVSNVSRLSPDSRTLLFATYQKGELHGELLDGLNGKVRNDFTLTKSPSGQILLPEVLAVFTSDSKTVVLQTCEINETGMGHFWHWIDVQSGQVLQTVKIPAELIIEEMLLATATSPVAKATNRQGDNLLVCVSNKQIQVMQHHEVKPPVPPGKEQATISSRSAYHVLTGQNLAIWAWIYFRDIDQKSPREFLPGFYWSIYDVNLGKLVHSDSVLSDGSDPSSERCLPVTALPGPCLLFEQINAEKQSIIQEWLNKLRTWLDMHHEGSVKLHLVDGNSAKLLQQIHVPEGQIAAFLSGDGQTLTVVSGNDTRIEVRTYDFPLHQPWLLIWTWALGVAGSVTLLVEARRWWRPEERPIPIALTHPAGYAGTMKCWPTPGRIILAVLLQGTAVAALTLWPHSCLFQISSENLVGFDEAQGLFYTTHRGSDGQVVSSYDLARGVKRSSDLLTLPPVDKESSQLWPCRLSGDKRFLIAARQWYDQVHVLKLPSLNPIRIDVLHDDQRILMSLGLSQDGGALLLCSLGRRSELIHMLDLDQTVIQIAQIAESLPMGFTGSRGNTLPPETMHMTSNRRYLATSLRGSSSTNVLYDMIEKKEVLKTTKDYEGISRFTPDGQTLVFLPDTRYQSPEAIWYRLENGTWSESVSSMLPLDKNENIQQACGNFFVTINKEIIEHAWAKHLPHFIQDKLAPLLQPERLHLRFWDLATGQLVPERSMAIPFKGAIGWIGGGWNPDHAIRPLSHEELTISDDGRFLAVKYDKVITVWETQPHRSLTCWLTAICLATVGLWLLRPRRLMIAAESLPPLPPSTPQGTVVT